MTEFWRHVIIRLVPAFVVSAACTLGYFWGSRTSKSANTSAPISPTPSPENQEGRITEALAKAEKALATATAKAPPEPEQAAPTPDKAESEDETAADKRKNRREKWGVWLIFATVLAGASLLANVFSFNFPVFRDFILQFTVGVGAVAAVLLAVSEASDVNKTVATFSKNAALLLGASFAPLIIGATIALLVQGPSK